MIHLDIPCIYCSNSSTVSKYGNGDLFSQRFRCKACRKLFKIEHFFEQDYILNQNTLLLEILNKKADKITDMLPPTMLYTDLMAKIDGLQKANEQLQKNNENLSKQLKNSLLNTTKQIEAFISIQNYLNFGEMVNNFHGWPISPDLGLYLLEKIIYNKYDVIIEFGSGTSTLLFAKIIKMLNKDNSSNISKKIITFEHHQQYYLQTLEQLNALELHDYVELIYAPLVDYSYEGKDYQYYDCDVSFEKISQSLPEKSKLMVLVDGPPGNTCENARFPALPYILKHLKQHNIDIILDDYARSEEKEVANLWRKELEEWSVQYVESMVNNEKGVLCLSIHHISLKEAKELYSSLGFRG